MRCHNCNAELEKDSKFCIHCGTELKKEELILEEESPEENISEENLYEETRNEEIQENPVQEEVMLTKAYKLNKIAIIALSSLILITMMITGYFYLSKEDGLVAHGEKLSLASATEEKQETLKEIHILDDIYTIAPDKIEKVEFYTFPEESTNNKLKWSSSNPKIKVNQGGFISSSDENQEGTITVSNEDGSIETHTKVKITDKTDSFFESINYIMDQNYTTRDYLNFSELSFDIGPRLQAEDRDLPTDIFGMINKEISGYKLVQKQFINIDTDNPIDCDVFIDNITGDIRKIVTIEYIDDYLEIKDFYFKDGKVYFIFNRNENYYRPVPAQQDFAGQRFYYNNDSLTRWRKIDKVGDAYEKTDYNYLDDSFQWITYLYEDLTNTDLQKPNYKKPEDDLEYQKEKEREFLKKEKRFLDEAYNLYNKVIEAPDTTNITGYVVNNQGQAMAGVVVKAFSDKYKLLACETKTKSDGSYNLLVPLNASNYTVIISKPGFVDTTIYGIDSDLAGSNTFQETVYLHEESYGIYNVIVNFRDALDGEELSNYSSNVEFILRKGINNKTGTIEYHDYLDLFYNPYYEVGLYPGTYTAEIITPGYESNYFTISTLYNNMEVNSNSVPYIDNDDVRIVLTWGANPSDLDSHLFLPNGNHIAYYSKQVDGGNLDIDDVSSYGPETVTINSLKNGTYKYYVADFTNSASGYYSSRDMALSNARVDVYNKHGLVSTFIVPSHREGVIWHVFNISDGVISPVQRIFNNVEDHKWWNSSKH